MDRIIAVSMHTKKELIRYFSLEDESYRLFEIKGDKQPIGVHWEETAFTTHSVYLSKEDTFYLFSDGFVDQYGGKKRKKFKTRNFKKLLLAVQDETMENQRRLLEKAYDNWSEGYEQIDDVCVMGVRLHFPVNTTEDLR